MPAAAHLRCEGTANRIIVSTSGYPKLTLEVVLDDLASSVVLRRERTEYPGAPAKVVSNVRHRIAEARTLDPADYRRLARQLLRPLFEVQPPRPAAGLRPGVENLM